jgi:hypothetical protein
MDSSGGHFYTSRGNPRRLASNHRLEDGRIARVDNVLRDEFRTARIYSTAGDLMAFLDLMDQEPYRSALARDDGVIEKNGGSDGVRAQVYLHTRLGYRFVLLANYDELPFQQTVEDIVRILEGKPYEVPKEIRRKAIRVPRALLERCAGAYDFAEANHTVLEFRVEGDELALYQDGRKLAVLGAESESVFFEDPASADSFEFEHEPRGGCAVTWKWRGITLQGRRK